MAKMVEITLQGLTCEFAGPEGALDVGGSVEVLGYDDPLDVQQREVAFGFPHGRIRMTKGQSLAIGRDVRIAMSTPVVDPPGIGVFFIKFGGELTAIDVGDDPRPATLQGMWQELSTEMVVTPDPFNWRLYIGRNDRIIRADFTVQFVHHL